MNADRNGFPRIMNISMKSVKIVAAVRICGPMITPELERCTLPVRFAGLLPIAAQTIPGSTLNVTRTESGCEQMFLREAGECRCCGEAHQKPLQAAQLFRFCLAPIRLPTMPPERLPSSICFLISSADPGSFATAFCCVPVDQLDVRCS